MNKCFTAQNILPAMAPKNISLIIILSLQRRNLQWKVAGHTNKGGMKIW